MNLLARAFAPPETDHNMFKDVQLAPETKHITVRITNKYGTKTIYPVCVDACIFAMMLNQKSLTQSNIERIKQLGYRVSVQPQEVEEL